MIWLQHWTDVLFLHFPLAPEQLRLFVPEKMAIETHCGSAWLSYVFFRLKLRPAWLPTVPGFSSLLELNVRTYVRHRDRQGICFLRMYADNHLAILASRLLTPLKYEAARITTNQHDDGLRSIFCQPRNAQSSIRLQYCVNSAPTASAATDSLDVWLLERYRAFVPRRDHSLLTAAVTHPPWRFASIDLRSYADELQEAIGIPRLGPPARAHYSPGVAVRFAAFTPADREPAMRRQMHQYQDPTSGSRNLVFPPSPRAIVPGRPPVVARLPRNGQSSLDSGSAANND